MHLPTESYLTFSPSARLWDMVINLIHWKEQKSFIRLIPGYQGSFKIDGTEIHCSLEENMQGN